MQCKKNIFATICVTLTKIPKYYHYYYFVEEFYKWCMILRRQFASKKLDELCDISITWMALHMHNSWVLGVVFVCSGTFFLGFFLKWDICKHHSFFMWTVTIEKIIETTKLHFGMGHGKTHNHLMEWQATLPGPPFFLGGKGPIGLIP